MKISDIIKVILKEFELGEIHAYLYVNGLITNTKIEYKKDVMVINNFPELPPLKFKFTDSFSKVQLSTIETKRNNEISSIDFMDVNYKQLQIYQLLYAPLLLSTIKFEHEEIRSIPISTDGLGEINLENNVITMRGKCPPINKISQNLINFFSVEDKNYERISNERDVVIKIDLGQPEPIPDFYKRNFMPRLLEIEQEEILTQDDIISIKFDPPTFFKD